MLNMDFEKAYETVEWTAFWKPYNLEGSHRHGYLGLLYGSIL